MPRVLKVTDSGGACEEINLFEAATVYWVFTFNLFSSSPSTRVLGFLICPNSCCWSTPLLGVTTFLPSLVFAVYVFVSLVLRLLPESELFSVV